MPEITWNEASQMILQPTNENVGASLATAVEVAKRDAWEQAVNNNCSKRG